MLIGPAGSATVNKDDDPLADAASHYKVDAKTLSIAVAKAEKDKTQKKNAEEEQSGQHESEAHPENRDRPQITPSENRMKPSFTGRPHSPRFSLSSKNPRKILTPSVANTFKGRRSVRSRQSR